MFDRIVGALNRWLAIVAIVFILIMIVSTVADNLGRYLFSSPITGTLELNRALLVFAVCLSLGYTQLRKRHMRVEAVLERLPATPRKIVDALWSLLGAAFMGVATYGSFLVARTAWLTGEHETGIISFPIWPGRMAVVLGCAALALQFLIEVIQAARLLKEKSATAKAGGS